MQCQRQQHPACSQTPLLQAHTRWVPGVPVLWEPSHGSVIPSTGCSVPEAQGARLGMLHSCRQTRMVCMGSGQDRRDHAVCGTPTVTTPEQQSSQNPDTQSCWWTIGLVTSLDLSGPAHLPLLLQHKENHHARLHGEASAKISITLKASASQYRSICDI